MGKTRAFVCTVCDRSCSSYYSLQRHAKTMHKQILQPRWKSSACGRKSSVCDMGKTQAFVCLVCDRSCSSYYSLQRHAKTTHKQILQPQRKSLACDICLDADFALLSQLREHHTALHGYIEEIRKLTFSSREEFCAWKKNEERETKARFCATTGAKVLHGDLKRTYYYCHRSGIYKARGTGQRKLKSQGSCKMNQFCLSSIEMTEDISSGQISVIYHSKHYGHTCDERHLGLPRERKAKQADKQAAGVSFQAVLDNIHDLGAETQVPESFHELDIEIEDSVDNAADLASDEEALESENPHEQTVGTEVKENSADNAVPVSNSNENVNKISTSVCMSHSQKRVIRLTESFLEYISIHQLDEATLNKLVSPLRKLVSIARSSGRKRKQPHNKKVTKNPSLHSTQKLCANNGLNGGSLSEPTTLQKDEIPERVLSPNVEVQNIPVSFDHYY